MRRAQQVTVVAGLGLALLGAGAWAVDRGPEYTSAAEMAERLDCSPTFRALPPFAGSLDAGTCHTPAGAEVELRVFPDRSAAAAWLRVTGAGGPGFEGGGGAAGDGWGVSVAQGSDAATRHVFSALAG